MFLTFGSVHFSFLICCDLLVFFLKGVKISVTDEEAAQENSGSVGELFLFYFQVLSPCYWDHILSFCENFYFKRPIFDMGRDRDGVTTPG